MAMTFGLALVPLVVAVGAGVDYSRANNIKAGLQSALDVATLAGARDNTANWTSVAENVFNITFQPKGGAATASFVLNGDGTFSGSASGTVPTTLLGVAGVHNINVSAHSSVMVAPTSPTEQYCMLALSLTASPAVDVDGNGSITITAPNCVMQTNSNAGNSVNLTGNATVNTTDNCFVGGVSKVGNSTLTPPPLPVCKTVPDPFANYTKPSVGACDYTNYSLSGNKTVTLTPGVYCGGMNFSGPVTVTFADGLYIIKDGTITESGGTFTGAHVTFFLTGSGVGFAMSGQANWHLVASSAPPFPGFVIFLDPNSAAAATTQLSGQSELYFEGVVYLPKQQVQITGTATAFAPSPWTSFVADTIKIAGNGQFVIQNNTAMTSVPIPVGLEMRSGGRMWLTQ